MNNTRIMNIVSSMVNILSINVSMVLARMNTISHMHLPLLLNEVWGLMALFSLTFTKTILNGRMSTNSAFGVN
jgi:hypothetical protein